jgi:membrane protease subunit (stomatin/prohibitin family)
MGLIRATLGAVGGTLADQWIDFFTVPKDISQTAAIFPAVLKSTNAGRGSNTSASDGIITNGSRIIIPEGYGLLTFQDGELTSLATDPGAYIWDAEALDAKSIFVDGDIVSLLVEQSWQRFRYGGRPSSQQLALFVSLKELPNNRFGTQNTIYWDDAYLNAQVGATTRGTYTIKIIDPVLFVRSFLPATFLQNRKVFEFIDPDNEIANQLFTEVVGSLAAAFSIYTNDPSKSNRISSIQRDSIGFALSLSKAVDDAFQWSTERGLAIVKVAILGIDYDEQTKSLLATVQRADALAGARGNVNLQASVAAGLEAAGAVDGAAGLLGLGLVTGSLGIESLKQDHGDNQLNSTDVPTEKPMVSQPNDSLISRLEQLKQALDTGLISQSDYNAAKNKALGI